MGLIDSHAHLTFPELRDRVDEILVRCDEAGVDEVVTVGTNPADSRAAVETARRYPGRVRAVVGVHPHDAGKVGDEELAAVSAMGDRVEVVGFGEMGLDYHYDFADRQVQQRVFARQLELASSRQLPIVIHSREAFDDTIRILLEQGYAGRNVVFHCFSGTREQAGCIEENGWWISLTGIITFRDAGKLQEVVCSYSADRVMLETDSPFLTPEPIRKKRPNEPAYVEHTARCLADLRGVDYENIVEQTAANTRRFFNV